MQKVIVNRYAEITKGVLKGQGGNVISFDSEIDKVGIELDKDTIVQVSSDNIEQEIFSIQKECTCGCQYTIKETEDDGKNLCHPCGNYF